MEWETPREAMLRAENNRLRAENEYLRRAVGYRWPEDTAEHRAMRAAFMDGAARSLTAS